MMPLSQGRPNEFLLYQVTGFVNIKKAYARNDQSARTKIKGEIVDWL
jgi:hypothetical protein